MPLVWLISWEQQTRLRHLMYYMVPGCNNFFLRDSTVEVLTDSKCMFYRRIANINTHTNRKPII